MIELVARTGALSPVEGLECISKYVVQLFFGWLWNVEIRDCPTQRLDHLGGRYERKSCDGSGYEIHMADDCRSARIGSGNSRIVNARRAGVSGAPNNIIACVAIGNRRYGVSCRV